MILRNFVFTLILMLGGVLQLNGQCISGDCVNGTGIYIYKSGARYVGQFKNGEIHGIGTCYYTDGSKYQGEWKSRFPEGKGTKTYADGTKRTGRWLKGKPVDENGKILEEYIAKKEDEQKDDDTDIQSGCLSGDCKNGMGIIAYPDGSKYEGNFKNKKYHGEGTFFFASGDKYVGHFVENFPHGKGTRYYANGSSESGEWRQGEFIGSNLIESGVVGCTEGDCENGKGTMIFKEGVAKYTGDFRNFMPHGFGICVYANGDRYRGNWSEGAFEGKGTLYLHDGREVSGWWKNGEFLGKEKPADAAENVASAPTETQKQNIEQVKTETKVWAVVVGVAAYNHMPVLRYTDDDAYRFYAFLKSLEGGALPDEQVQILIDEEATRASVLEKLDETFAKAGQNDLVVFYFSGHGLNGSFLPIDFDGFNNKILHEEIAERFNKCPAKYKLCIADACHSGSIIAMRSGGETETELSKFYRQLAKSVSGTALLMSSKSDETSLESQGLRQGVFSHFLIRGLKGEADKDKSGIVSLDELYQFVFDKVREYTANRQSPVIKGTYDPQMPVALSRKY